MATNKTYRYLDLSGYAFSGKEAVIELVREFTGFAVPESQFEFLLIRIQGGIRDLETALLDDWSPIRSDAAIRRLRQLIKRFGTRSKFSDPRTWFTSVGLNYEARYSNRFFDLSSQYLDNLIIAEWPTFWPYPMAEVSSAELFLRKVMGKLGVRKAHEFKVCLATPNRFIELTRTYLNELLSSNVPEDTSTIVMHNAFEPFNPQRALRYFDRAKCIIVDRDPRDTYVAMLRRRPWAMLVQDFIVRYQLHREIVQRNAIESPDILRLQYEDLVLDYDVTLSRILEFLGENRAIHACRKKHFDPGVSIQHVGIWRRHENQEEIELIHRGLGRFCYD